MNPATKLLAVFALPLCALAQSVSTDPVGFVTIPTLSNSDTIFSTPLARPEVFRGLVGAVSSSTVTASGTPGWTVGAFVYAAGTQSNTYYLRFRTGAKAGCFYTITANTAAGLTLDLAGDLLTGAAAGDEFAIVPYWTLGTVFPAGAAGTAFEASLSALAQKTQILTFPQNQTGINLGANAIFYFANGAWRKSGATATLSFNDTLLVPDTFVAVRNKNFTGSVNVMGGVMTGAQTAPVNSYPAAKQDNLLAAPYPVAVSLRNSRLIESGAFRVSASALAQTDQLLVFDNTAAGINKGASAIYYYFNNAWRKVGSSAATDFGDDQVFKPGSGVVIRKGADATGPKSSQWTFTPPAS
jgi:uncharacterized protein (TIGR02597 family)